MERKIKVFLETTFLIYEVPKAKIKEAIDFVMKFDWKLIAQGVIDNMLEF